MEKYSSFEQNDCDDIGPAYFDDDPRAVALREATDYSIKISLKDARAGRNKRPIRVYGDGVYDMFHVGHARQLSQARAAFPGPVYLLVGAPTDAEVYRIKQGDTIMKQHERAEALRHCRYVDEVIMSAPFNVTAQFLEKNKIDFVAHDDLPYPVAETDCVYKWLKDCDRFLPTRRTVGVSTSDIVARLIKRHEPKSRLWRSYQWLRRSLF